MNKKPGTSKDAADKLVKNIHRKTRQTYETESLDVRLRQRDWPYDPHAWYEPKNRHKP